MHPACAPVLILAPATTVSVGHTREGLSLVRIGRASRIGYRASAEAGVLDLRRVRGLGPRRILARAGDR
jgi:hypothetical protein